MEKSLQSRLMLRIQVKETEKKLYSFILPIVFRRLLDQSEN